MNRNTALVCILAAYFVFMIFLAVTALKDPCEKCMKIDRENAQIKCFETCKEGDKK